MFDVDEQVSHSLYQRLVWSLVWLGVLDAGINAWSSWTSWDGMAVLAPLIVLLGISGMAVMWLEEGEPSDLLQHVSLAMVGVAAFVSQVVNIASRKFYNTDAGAFNQQATQLFLNGKNPYTHSLIGASKLLDGIANYWTYTLNGGHVVSMSYPAGSILLQAPLQALGVTYRTTDWLDLLAWFASTIILYLLVPKSLRWISPVLMLMGPYLFSFANGGTDALFLPFLLLAVWRWDSFAKADASRLARWTGPISLAVACSIKQSPWFCVPFLAFGIYLEARVHHDKAFALLAKYLGIVVGLFLLINSPFIIWSPSAWFHGTVLPLVDPLIPDGQGLVTLATHGIVRGIHLRILAVAGILGWICVGLAYVLWYKNLKRAWLFLLPVVLFIPSRSLSSYFVDFFPAAIVAAATTTRADGEFLAGLSTRAKRLVLAGPVALLLVVAGYSFTSPALNVRLITFSTAYNNVYLATVKVELTNNTSAPLNAHLMVRIAADHPTGFWLNSSNSNSLYLPAHQTKIFELHQPAWTFAPRTGEHWILEAFTSSPQTLSTSVPFVWNLYNSF